MWLADGTPSLPTDLLRSDPHAHTWMAISQPGVAYQWQFDRKLSAKNMNFWRSLWRSNNSPLYTHLLSQRVGKDALTPALMAATQNDDACMKPQYKSQ